VLAGRTCLSDPCASAHFVVRIGNYPQALEPPANKKGRKTQWENWKAKWQSSRVAEFGHIDVLFVNAGVGKFAPVAAVTEDFISPGPISTPIFNRLGLPPEALEETARNIREQVPMKQFGRPEEIAKTALFLASSDSSFLLGTEIVADGGMSQL